MSTKKNPVSFSQFLTQISTQGSLSQDKLSVLDDIKNELKQEKAKKIRQELMCFHRQMDEKVQSLRIIRAQEKAVIAQIKNIENEVEKYLAENSEEIKI